MPHDETTLRKSQRLLLLCPCKTAEIPCHTHKQLLLLFYIHIKLKIYFSFWVPTQCSIASVHLRKELVCTRRNARSGSRSLQLRFSNHVLHFVCWSGLGLAMGAAEGLQLKLLKYF